ncbi:MAG: CrcB family protein [Schlesneria sp.]
MWNLLLVGTGGGLGAMLRYGISTMMKTLLPGYIGAGTLIVNVIGSLAIGYVLGSPHDSKSVADSMRLFFVVGVLGGLTTFSSLAYETFFIANNPGSGIVISLGHMTANVLLGLAAVWFGAYLARPIPIV